MKDIIIRSAFDFEGLGIKRDEDIGFTGGKWDASGWRKDADCRRNQEEDI